ncbi:hypothetical protein DPMN_150478 [Dreissena polymorpha]|uniref:Uncharacterized protein n=1 Tax=Dreissena polymorpha TaxID=45954 RepID=A0A9D4FHS8_DREPO|nr:hypothetical protein DPMN_150478 [Dreissena polymorpha]
MNCCEKSRLDAELGGAQWNISSAAESSLRNTCNINAGPSTSSLTWGKLSTACGMMAYCML